MRGWKAERKLEKERFKKKFKLNISDYKQKPVKCRTVSLCDKRFIVIRYIKLSITTRYIYNKYTCYKLDIFLK
jgi:hypothetical protein